MGMRRLTGFVSAVVVAVLIGVIGISTPASALFGAELSSPAPFIEGKVGRRITSDQIVRQGYTQATVTQLPGAMKESCRLASIQPSYRRSQGIPSQVGRYSVTVRAPTAAASRRPSFCNS